MRSCNMDLHVCAARTRTGMPCRSHRERKGQRDTNSHIRFSERIVCGPELEYEMVIAEPSTSRLRGPGRCMLLGCLLALLRPYGSVMIFSATNIPSAI